MYSISFFLDIANSIFRPKHYICELHYSHQIYLWLVPSHLQLIKMSNATFSIVFAEYSKLLAGSVSVNAQFSLVNGYPQRDHVTEFHCIP